MTTIDRTQLIADLEQDEGLRPLVYDDAAPGRPVVKGTIIKGNLTTGIGWNVMARALTDDQYRTICGWQADETCADLVSHFPWVLNMTEPRQRALANMAFNLGLPGLAKFDTFMKFLSQGNYASAALDLRGTLWYQQVGGRAGRIVDAIRTG